MNEVKNIRSMTEATCSLSLKIYENNMNGKSSNEISFNSLFLLHLFRSLSKICLSIK